jgi:hypothetical protein
VTNDGIVGFTFSSDGPDNPSLVLLQGTTYTFNIQTAFHPFWIRTTITNGIGSTFFAPEVTGNGAISPNAVTFTPNATNLTEVYFYNCQFHAPMHGILYTVPNLCAPPTTATPTTAQPTTFTVATTAPPTVTPTFSIPDNATAVSVAFVFTASDDTAHQMANGNQTAINAVVLELIAACSVAAGVNPSNIVNVSLVNASNGVRLFNADTRFSVMAASGTTTYAFVFAFTLLGHNLTQSLTFLQAQVGNSSSVFYTTLASDGTPVGIDSGTLAQVEQITFVLPTTAPASSALSTGALIGIAVGAAVGFIIIAWLLFVWLRWCWEHRNHDAVPTVEFGSIFDGRKILDY